MTKKAVIRELESQHMKKDLPRFNVGDTVRVHLRIIEGEKERIQMFAGTVIAKTGCGMSETFSIHRVAYGEGMERVFMLHSPRIATIEVLKEGVVRRAKLYYLRGTTGKRARVKSRLGGSRLKGSDKAKNAPIEALNEESGEYDTISAAPGQANNDSETSAHSREDNADA